MTIRLSAEALSSLEGRVSVPAYNRETLSAGIFHFGIGNFHRAHQAVYLDDLFNLGEGHDWALIGSGVREADEAMRQKLMAQDWLTTVVSQEAGSSSARVTGAMIDYISPGDAAAIMGRLADPAIRIVSLTITEGGYFIDPATQRFDPGHPEIAYDAAHIEAPKTAFGLILAGLMRRKIAGIDPFTVMSCDNIPHNGRVTRDAVAGLAALVDPVLAQWVMNDVAFPSSMVDRITPATSERERQLLAEQYGIEDAWPVFCEDFRQWVLEDNFPSGRPALEKVGVQFVPDVSPYELMKIRILNGGHATIAYPAALMDIHFVHEAMQHPMVSAFLAKLERDEIVTVVPPVPDTNLHDYIALCERRFANPKIGDTVRRLALDGSNRQPKFIIPSALDRVTSGRSVTGLALVSALWCRFCHGATDSGAAVELGDPMGERLTAQAKLAKCDPKAWLSMVDIYGDLASNQPFIAAFSHALATLWTIGTKATLERYLANQL